MDPRKKVPILAVFGKISKRKNAKHGRSPRAILPQPGLFSW